MVIGLQVSGEKPNSCAISERGSGVDIGASGAGALNLELGDQRIQEEGVAVLRVPRILDWKPHQAVS